MRRWWMKRKSALVCGQAIFGWENKATLARRECICKYVRSAAGAASAATAAAIALCATDRRDVVASTPNNMRPSYSHGSAGSEVEISLPCCTSVIVQNKEAALRSGDRTLASSLSHLQHQWTGGLIWMSAAKLATFEVELGPEYWRGKRVAEIGAGCGLAGIVAAGLGAEVLLTDRHTALLEYNVRRNFNVASRIKVRQLCWGNEVTREMGEFDVVLGSDVLQEAGEIIGEVNSLVHTVVALCARLPARATVFICQPVGDPSRMQPFIQKMKDEGFRLRVAAPPRDMSPIIIFEFLRG